MKTTTTAEIQLRAFDYLISLEPFVWHNFQDVPEDINLRVFQIIDSNTLAEEYRLIWNAHFENLFMKSIKTEYNIQNNEPGCCCFKST